MRARREVKNDGRQYREYKAKILPLQTTMNVPTAVANIKAG
jgi:hypothetical protein